MEELSDMNSEIDVNILVSIYNEKINALSSSNVLLEARLKSIVQEFTKEKNTLLMANLELQKELDLLKTSEKSSGKESRVKTLGEE